jgi:hypothetical protein
MSRLLFGTGSARFWPRGPRPCGRGSVGLLFLVPGLLLADERTNPPTIQETAPLAITRGKTTEIRVKGINLAGASEVVFDNPAVTGRVEYVNRAGKFEGKFIGSNGTKSTIERGSPAPLHEVVMEVEAAAGAELELTRFRLITAAGSTDMQTLSIEPDYAMAHEIEPNDDLAALLDREAEAIAPPVIVAGVIAKPGDVDVIAIEGKAGEELVLLVTAGQIGSRLRWKIELVDRNGTALASKTVLESDRGPALGYRIPADGRYFVRVSDIDSGGGKGHFYRLRVGELPFLTSVYPLGVRRGGEGEVALRGYNLGDERAVKVRGEADYEGMSRAELRPALETGESHNRLPLAVGSAPEILEEEGAAAMAVDVPVTVNGRVSGFADGEGRSADEDSFRFRGRKGVRYVVEVEARRLGSPLDSVIEILDADAKPISRATARAEFATRLVLNDRTSSQVGLRLEDVEHFRVGDWVLIGNEILRVNEEPRGPDSDYFFAGFGGMRTGFLDTTPEAHAMETPVYKVSLHPPHTEFPPNGLPVRQLYYRNDDGGPGLDKDSKLTFQAPADSEYLVRLRDLRGFQGEDFAYRLTVRETAPDFRLLLGADAPNVPRGGSVAVEVSALRIDGFDGPVRLRARGLPAGITASEETIAAGETSAVLVLTAAKDAHLDGAAPFEIEGVAELGGKSAARLADPDERLRILSLAGEPDIFVELEGDGVALEAGGTATVAVRVERRNGFTGRVPVTALNLPYGVKVTNIGLNGVLVRPDETRREFTLAAESWVEPQQRGLTVTGRVETRSPRAPEYAAEPIRLEITKTRAAGNTTP